MTRARFSDGVLVLSILALVFLMLGKVPQLKAGDTRGLLFYLFIPTVLALVLSLILRAPRKLKSDIVLVSVSSLLSLYAGEITLSLYGKFKERSQRQQPSIKQWEAARKQNIPFDSRTPLQALLEMRREDPNLVPIMTPSQFWFGEEPLKIQGKAVIPLGSISRAPTLYCNEGGKYLTYQSDEHGFHNPLGLYDGKAAQILVVGDSFAQGACVPSDENAASRIRETYPRLLNLGFADNGPLTELATLREYGPALRPPVVLWFFYEGNDMDGLLNEKTNSVLNSYLSGDTQDLVHQQKEIDEAVRGVIEARLSRSLKKEPRGLVKADFVDLGKQPSSFLKFRALRKLLGWLPEAGVRMPAGEWVHPGTPLFREVMSLAKREVRSWGGHLYFVYLPEWQNFGVAGFARPDRSGVLDVVRELGITTIDLMPVFRQAKDPLSYFPFRLNGHYTPEGYRVVAETVLKKLKEEQALNGL